MASIRKSKSTQPVKITLSNLAQFSLSLTPDQKTALALQGQVVLVPGETGLEIRVLRNGALVAPTVVRAIGRAKPLLDLVKEHYQKVKPDPIALFLRAKKVIDSDRFTKAYNNVKDVQTKLKHLDELSSLLDTYQAGEFEMLLKAFFGEVISPTIRRMARTYWTDEAYMERSFTDYFDEKSEIGPSVLRLVNEKPDLAKNSLRQKIFPKDPQSWLSVKPEIIISSAWDMFAPIISDADRIPTYMVATDFDTVYAKTKDLVEAEAKDDKLKRPRAIRVILPPRIPIKETYGSRGSFGADWAAVHKSLGNFQAWNMGLLIASTMISGLRRGVSTGFFVEKLAHADISQYDWKGDETIYQATIELKLIGAQSWGFVQKVEPSITDRFKQAIEGKQVQMMAFAYNGVTIELKLEPEELKAAIANRPKVVEEKEMKFISAYPLEVGVRGLLTEADFPPGLKGQIASFLKTLPGDLQADYLNRFLAAAQGELELDVSIDQW